MAIENYDLIVVGLGAAGSAAVCQAAFRGARVLGIDRHHPPHEFGSSHGETRITRQAIGEGAEFVPLVLRANVLWKQIEAATGEQLLVQNGGLILLDAEDPGVSGSGRGADFFQQTVDCAQRFHIAHEMLRADEIRCRFPQFVVQDGALGYLEPGAGYLRPEPCIAAQLSVAQANKASLQMGEIVTGIAANGSTVEVTTDRSSYHAPSVVITPGPWMPDWAQAICGLPPAHFAVYRQTLYWFALAKSGPAFSREHMPIFIWSSAEVEKGFYGFPSLDGVSLKVATEQFDHPGRASDGKGEVTAGQAREFYDSRVAATLNGVSNTCVRSATCFYTVVPDHGFFIDHAVDSDRIWFASACSGHGFKHAAAVGEALAQKALGEAPVVDLQPFARRPNAHE